MQRYTVDHRAGAHGRGRDAYLADETGRRVLCMYGDWAVTNEQGRTVLFISPNLGEIAKAAIVGGILDGLLGGAGDLAYSPNAGPGRQTMRRARVPARGIPPRSTPVATVVLEKDASGHAAYRIERHEPELPEVSFRRVDMTSLAEYANGFRNPGDGVIDLAWPDGRPILRHWATVGADRRLDQSVFDVVDTGYPLAEAVVLCMARYAAWRDG